MTTVMTNVYWALGSQKYANLDDFVTAATAYNQEINPKKSAWQPNQTICDGPISVVYEAAWKDEDDTIEIAIGHAGDVVTMGLALFTINNASVDFFRHADKHFFEGLALLKGTKYRLMVGS